MPASEQTVFLYQLVLILTLSTPLVLMAFSWPSARNLTVVQGLPFVLIAYVAGPVFLITPLKDRLFLEEEALTTLSFALVAGTIPFVLGFHLAFRERNLAGRLTDPFMKGIGAVAARPGPAPFIALFGLATLSIALYAYAYLGMGFIPAFTENPLTAKYMAGDYFDRYEAYAAYYRLAIVLYGVTCPFLIIAFLALKGPKRYLVLIWLLPIFVLTLFTLRRAVLAEPILLTLLICSVWYRGGRYVGLMALFYLALFCFGSAANDVIYYLIGLREEIDLIAIVKGAPDVADLTWFWLAWHESGAEHSLGRTVFGGLVPYHYEWNPAVVTKLVIGAETTTNSGGFRLPPLVWGFVAYGWGGVLLWGLFQGLAAGLALRMIRTVLERKDMGLMAFFLSFAFASLVGRIVYNLFRLNIDFMVATILIAGLLFLFRTPITFFPTRERLASAPS